MSTKAELKENILASKLESIVPTLITYRIQILIGLGIVIAAGLISSVFIIRRNETRSVQWWQLSQAQILFNQNQPDAATQLLTGIKNGSPGSTEAFYAQYYAGQFAISQKKYDDAIQSFSGFISQAGNHPLRPLALSNLAYSYEQKGDYAAAVQTYQQFMSQYSEHFLAARSQLELGKALLRSGDPEGAKKSLGQLIDLYPTSPWAQNARRIMDKLETR